jgi:hypothetical protein
MKKIALIFGLIILIGACKRSNDSKVGPSICPSDAFTHTGLSHATVAPLASPGGFTLKDTLSEEVDWSITIRGNTSGSVKRYSDRSSKIDVTWYGEPDTALFFNIETCTVTLKFACKDAIVSTFDITTKPTFTNVPNMKLISDFEGNGATTTWGGYGNEQNDVKYNAVVVAPSDPSPQGGNYYKFVGDSIAPSYYFGGFYSGGAAFAMPGTWTDPSKVYVNIFVNCDGITNSEIQILETPKGLGEVFRKQAKWTGWKLVSFKLSDYEYLQPLSVTGFDIGVGSAPEKGYKATIKVDFLIMTYGKPFFVETGI